METGVCSDVRCSMPSVDIYRHTGVNNVPHYTTSAVPPMGEIAGGRIGGLWRDPGPRLVPMYYCNALNVIGWVSSEALCEGQPAVGVLLGYAGETLPLPECAVWGRRLSRCDNMEQLTVTASLAVRNALIAMNAGGLQCRRPAPGCIYQEDGWENTRSFLP